MNSRQAELSSYIQERKRKTVSLLPVLHKAKALYGEIDLELERKIAREMEIPFSRVSAAVTFYSAFNGMDDGDADDRFLKLRENHDQTEWILNHPEGYQAVQKVLREQTDVIALLRDAKVCGKSGSGFPVASKWSLTKDAPGEVKYIICNGSEGEGNTYKDYLLLYKKPEVVIEGMILCSLMTGIEQGFLYIRAEYQQAMEHVERAIVKAYTLGFLGENICGSNHNFHLEAVLGGGAYVSGEETGLLQALEGKRSEPRLKPPYPGISGLYDKPTIVNNAESFAAAASLTIHGAEKFRELGTESAGGSKLYTVCGCVKYPGIYEVPHYLTAAELLETTGGALPGRSVKGFQIGGGATGSFGGIGSMDTILDYQSLRSAGLALGTASIYFIDADEAVPRLALKSISFLKDQSCGMCTACRFGLSELTVNLELLCNGLGTQATLNELKELCIYIEETSRCALGQAAPTALDTALREFGKEFEALCRKEDSYEYYQL